MVDNATLSRPKIQDLADHVSSYFVPVIILLLMTTLIVWIAVGITVQKNSMTRRPTKQLTWSSTKRERSQQEKSRSSVNSLSRYTIFCVTLGSKICAIYGLSDTLRPGAAAVIAKLKETGVHISLLSGDGAGAVQHIAMQIGLNSDETRSCCSSGDKQVHIHKLSSEAVGKKIAVFVFVGDGTNDAVAWTQASIGVHMGRTTGTDVAQNAADVVLMQASLEGVFTMINIAYAAVLPTKFNFA
ncbi:heavy metal translocatin [Venturia nashicola]|nr:heavy metal translocatin [Venturia nashicola]